MLKITTLLKEQIAQPTEARAQRLAALEAAHPAAYEAAERLELAMGPLPAAVPDGPESDPATGYRGARNWADWLGGHETTGPVRLYVPKDIAALRAALAVDATPVRVRSSGHADNANGQPVPGGRMIDLERIDAIDAPGVDTARVAAGAKIHEVNTALASTGRALATMGSFDGQTVAGALCTGTHGSFTKMGPLAELVTGLTALRPDGTAVTVDAHDPDLPAMACGIGLCGIVTSVTLRVRPKPFRLREQRWTSTWASIRNQLVAGVSAGLWSDRVEIHINPYPTTARRYDQATATEDHTALITERYEAGTWTGQPAEWGAPFRHSVVALGKLMPTWVIRGILPSDRAKVGKTLDTALNLLATAKPGEAMHSNLARSDEILILGVGKKGHGFEVAVPLQTVPAFIDHTLTLCAEEMQDANGSVLFAPLSLRFVKATDLPIAPQNRWDNQGRPVKIWCMCEIPRIYRENATEDNRHVRIPRKLIPWVLDAGGRPHWGQHDALDGLLWNGAPVTVDRLYPRTAATWRAVRSKMDPTGLMLNHRNKAMGLG